MYEPYDYGEPIDDDEGYRAKPRAGAKKSSSSRWVFISRKVDIGLVLVLLLSTGFGIMWLISQLPIFVETASNHYHWAKAVYATWGTPSMRWLFINLVVGVIVATSGLLSAFGGDSSSAQVTDRSAPGYDKGVEYRGPEPGVLYGSADHRAYNASEARFTGPGYESPLYNPYVEEPVKERQHHESLFGSWNHSDDTHSEERRGREREREREREGGHHHRGMHHGSMDEAPAPFARPLDPEVMRAAKPVSRQGSQRRGVPTPADEGAVPLASRDLPKELFDTPPMARGGDMPSGEIPNSREIPREMPPMEEPPPPPPPLSRESPVPEPMEPAPVEEEAPPTPETQASEELSSSAVGSRKEDAIEIISKVYDPVPELAQLEADHGDKLHRLNTDSAIHYSGPLDGSLADSSPARAEALHKSHTFTLSRVIRRDQLADFIEPLSRKLEGIGRKVSLKSSHSESGIHHHHHHQSRELPGPVAPGAPSAAIEAVRNQPAEKQHNRRSSESGSSSSSLDGSIPKQTSSVPVIPNKVPPIVPPSPPSTPRLKQRSIVYPPALLSQVSIPAVEGEELSPPPSPPIEEAIPPPPPPHLKLPAAAATKVADPASMLSSDELPSFKFNLAPFDSTDSAFAAKASKKQVAAEKVSSSDDSKKPPSGKHLRTPSTIPPSQSKEAGTPEASSSGPDERSLTVKARKSNAGDEKVVEVKEGAAPPRPSDRQESSSGGKDDDLHQQIEDFLARFHENWRLQRQESLARYKKRLTELDEE